MRQCGKKQTNRVLIPVTEDVASLFKAPNKSPKFTILPPLNEIFLRHANNQPKNTVYLTFA
jgi:hypothetical protein